MKAGQYHHCGHSEYVVLLFFHVDTTQVRMSSRVFIMLLFIAQLMSSQILFGIEQYKSLLFTWLLRCAIVQLIYTILFMLCFLFRNANVFLT